MSRIRVSLGERLCSLASRSAQSTCKSPERIQSSTGTTCASLPPATNDRKIGHDKAALTNKAPVVTTLAGSLPMTRPPRPATSAAMSGRKTIRMTGCISRASG